MMRRLVLACVFSSLPPAATRADFVSEGAFGFAARVSANYNTPPSGGGPTYSLVTTSPVSGLSPLSVNFDLRGTGNVSDSALKFALASILPPGSSILAATLTFTVQGSQVVTSISPVLVVSGFSADPTPVSLGDFGRATTTLGSTPALGNTGFGGATLPPFSFDVTSYLRLLQGQGADSVGFRFDDSGGNVFIAAPNDPNPALKPTLAITYAAAVPEPASAALATLGLTLALTVAHRRRGAGAGNPA